MAIELSDKGHLKESYFSGVGGGREAGEGATSHPGVSWELNERQEFGGETGV